MTRFTRETALREMFHQYMRPPRSIKIMTIVMRTTMEEATSRPDMMTLTMKTVPREIANDFNVSCHIVKYCS